MDDDDRPSAPPPGSVIPPSDSQQNPAAEPASPRSRDPEQLDGLAGDVSRRRLRPLETSRIGSGSSRSNTSPSAKRPEATRRLSSSRHVPHRGDSFSVHDAAQEVNRDTARRQASLSSGSLRHQSSTLRRRPPAATRMTIIESNEDEDPALQENAPASTNVVEEPAAYEDDEATPADADDDSKAEEEEDESADLSDAESFTLRDRQKAINETHPFGIRVWKPALYKKQRSVEKSAESDIRSAPGGRVSRWLWFFNFGWSLVFGWWLALIASVGGLLCHLLLFAPGCRDYGAVLWGFAGYILYPFGKYVSLIQEEAYAEEDEGEGRSISEYERWQRGDLEEGRLFFGPVRSLVGRHRREEDSEDEEETRSLLGRNGANDRNGAKTKRRLFGRGQWNVGRVIFFVFFYGMLAPLLFLVSGICWLLIFSLPMARVTMILYNQLRRRPLALEFYSDTSYSRGPGVPPSSILLCTYRAVGTKYWKYTIDGTNIILINLLSVVVFVIFDYWVLFIGLGMQNAITNNIFMFLLALFSIIPLAYFIGQAVASISAQSTMGVGAAVNAFFSTIVEVFLYCVALKEGKSQLVEGSVIGSIFAGILFLPGLSMCFGAIKRKTQRFNVRSAGVTSTMLLFAVIGAFGPTLFYQIFGSHELNCTDCVDPTGDPLDRDCQRCFFAQIPAVHDPFYEQVVRPYTYFAAVLLFLSYIIGLLFTLRTHAATIWNTEIEEKKTEREGTTHRASVTPAQKPPSVDYGTVSQSQHGSSTAKGGDIRESPLYKRILGQSLRQVGLSSPNEQVADGKRRTASEFQEHASMQDSSTSKDFASGVPQKRQIGLEVQSLSDDDRTALVRQMAEMAATAAAVAARDAGQAPRKTSQLSKVSSHGGNLERVPTRVGVLEHDEHHGGSSATAGAAADEQGPAGGHDAPNWSRSKSYVVLLTATLAYAVIAEILVTTVDAVLENVAIDQKFLGITLFALVPNTTEFLNAISFAMNGNIALSMEIGSAYALQVCLLQVPALVLFSAVSEQFIKADLVNDYTFSLIFPQWDMVTVILCVFLLSYMYGEGKSNYFKGSILILSYLVVMTGFYCAGFDNGNYDGPKHSHGGNNNGEMRTIAWSGRYKTMGSKSRPIVM